MLLQTWRWYGPGDPVSLQDIRQAGAKGIVTALHHIPHGELWSVEEIKKRKEQVESAGLQWDVVESVNVHEEIKTRSGDYKKYLAKYNQTLRNLADCGIHTVCYNFMPVLDWTRTQLDYEVQDGAKALRFDWTDLAVFDLYLLKRKGAEKDYHEETQRKAKKRFQSINEKQKEILTENILMGVPGEKSVTIEALSKSIETYTHLGREGLKENLVYFLSSVMDTCEEYHINMTIHPDDPPISILGLPRIVSSLSDLQYIIKTVDRKPNGICFCTGSLGAGKQNDLVQIIKAVGERVYFVHLRNVTKEPDHSFYEANHLEGDVDMYGVMKELVLIQQKRKEPIPFRPDHGHQMLDDLKKKTNPGYSAIGRLRGLAELRGLEMGITKGLSV
ncbi:MAG: mannonate dehydratase [Chitinophagaceae bacterium]|nr:MAG: mannonate dehydratase [Chitinophagaceae bacterium]